MFDCCEHILKARRLARAVSKITRLIDWFVMAGVASVSAGLFLSRQSLYAIWQSLDFFAISSAFIVKGIWSLPINLRQ
jgi:hypothetical protein